jgi:UDP:flavonoid glycosyltransferase YjiC (YdhE family)
VFDTLRPIAFAQHAAPVNRMLCHFRLPQGPRDIRHAYTDADFTLYSDIREMVATAALPHNHQFIGPVQWAPKIAPPPWWDEAQRREPIVYLNLGSSGWGKLLPTVLAAVGELGITTITASVGCRRPTQLRANEFVAEFLPGEIAAAAASIVICNGGSPTCYQALAAGKPVIGLPMNLDQYLNMSLVARAGAGILVRPRRCVGVDVATAVRTILGDSSFSHRALALQACIRRSCPHDALNAILASVVEAA